MVRPMLFRTGKSFLGLARIRDVRSLQESYLELWDEVQAIKEFLNLETGKKLVEKKSVADTVLETFAKIAPQIESLTKKNKKNG